MITNYGGTAVCLNGAMRSFDYSETAMPYNQSIAQNATYIALTGQKLNDMMYPTSLFMIQREDSPAGFVYFPMVPLKFQDNDALVPPSTASDSRSRSAGAFGCPYSNSTSLATSQQAWRTRCCGFDSRTATKPINEFLKSTYWTGTINIDALNNTGADLYITGIPNPFYPTGLWVERISGSGTWWVPCISIAPHTNSFPVTGGTLRIRVDMPGTGYNCAANALRIRVAGFTCQLNYYDAPCPAMAIPTTEGISATTEATVPTNFRMLGAYQIGRNSSNYFNRPWGLLREADNAAGKKRVLWANTLNIAGTQRTTAANDMAIRLVGINV